MKFAKLFFVIMAVFVGISFYAASAAEWTDIVGKVTAEDGTPLCTMVLANGQHMFTCDPAGEYALSVPLGENGQITLFAFCDGFAPFKEIMTPDRAAGFDIAMSPASPDSGTMIVTSEFANVGEWTDWSFTITEDAMNVFNETLKYFDGSSFTPLAFSTQVVDGINYCYLCKGKGFFPDSPEFAVKLYIHAPLPGQGSPYITQMVNIEP